MTGLELTWSSGPRGGLRALSCLTRRLGGLSCERGMTEGMWRDGGVAESLVGHVSRRNQLGWASRRATALLQVRALALKYTYTLRLPGKWGVASLRSTKYFWLARVAGDWADGPRRCRRESNGLKLPCAVAPLLCLCILRFALHILISAVGCSSTLTACKKLLTLCMLSTPRWRTWDQWARCIRWRCLVVSRDQETRLGPRNEPRQKHRKTRDDIPAALLSAFRAPRRIGTGAELAGSPLLSG
ncbi:hypothetical protein VUR80DRAFT_8489 [Thermomyces stellatus]